MKKSRASRYLMPAEDAEERAVRPHYLRLSKAPPCDRRGDEAGRAEGVGEHHVTAHAGVVARDRREQHRDHRRCGQAQDQVKDSPHTPTIARSPSQRAGRAGAILCAWTSASSISCRLTIMSNPSGEETDQPLLADHRNYKKSRSGPRTAGSSACSMPAVTSTRHGTFLQQQSNTGLAQRVLNTFFTMRAL